MKGRKYANTPTQPLRQIVGAPPATNDLQFTSSIDQLMQQPITLQTAINPPQPKLTPKPAPVMEPMPLSKSNTGGTRNEKVQERLPEIKADESLLSDETKKNLRDAGILISGALATFGAGISGGNTQAAAQQMYSNLDRAAQADIDAKLADPNSEESKKARELGQQLYGNKIKIKPDMSAKEFRELSPVFDKLYQRKLQEQMAMVRANTPKPSDTKVSTEYREHINALDDTIEQAKLIKQLGRKPGGSYLPDLDSKTKALASAINAKSLNQAKAAAGPGAFTDTEREIYMPLTANANEASSTALEKIRTNVTTGVTSTMRKLDSDLRAGNINANDYDRLVTEYDRRLRAFGMGLDDNNQVVQLRRK